MLLPRPERPIEPPSFIFGLTAWKACPTTRAGGTCRWQRSATCRRCVSPARRGSPCAPGNATSCRDEAARRCGDLRAPAQPERPVGLALRDIADDIAERPVHLVRLRV